MYNAKQPKRSKALYKIGKRLLGLIIILLVGFFAWLLLFSTDQVKTVPRDIPNDSSYSY